MNEKIEKSPYLLAHEDDLVKWNPWKEEFFLKSKELRKPIFLNAGYASSYFGRRMSIESFKDEEVAKILNEKYICILVDRDERPDIDKFYKQITNVICDEEEWPLICLLTPNKLPFLTSLYLPRNATGSYNGLIDIIKASAHDWGLKLSELAKVGTGTFEALEDMVNDKAIRPRSFEYRVSLLKRTFDYENGGFGKNQKVIYPQNILFLFQYYYEMKNADTLKMITKTLDEMMYGGIYDHIGNGFFRYANDKTWKDPQTEKSLYDNALVASCYFEAYKLLYVNNNIEDGLKYLEVAKNTLKFLDEEMLSSNGYYISGIAADSPRYDGKYYALAPKDLIECLGDEKGFRLAEYLNINDNNYLPYLTQGKPKPDDLEESLESLKAYRKNRYPIQKDDKCITTANFMVIVAFLKAYGATREKVYLDKALKLLEFIETNLIKDDQIYVLYYNETIKTEGFLDEYAYYLLTLLEFYRVLKDENYLKKMKKYIDYTLESFFDYENGGFFYTTLNHEQMLVRGKLLYDHFYPDGNNLMAYVMTLYTRMVRTPILKALLTKHFTYLREHRNLPHYSSFYLKTIMIHNRADATLICAITKESDKEVVNSLFNRYFLPHLIIKFVTNNLDYKTVNGKITYYLSLNFNMDSATTDHMNIINQLT